MIKGGKFEEKKTNLKMRKREWQLERKKRKKNHLKVQKKFMKFSK